MKKRKNSTSQARIKKAKKEILEQLRHTPIIQVVCEKMGIPRSTLYRWRDEDEDFDDEILEAIDEGDRFLDDMVESKFMALINDKYWPAINSYITKKHPKYRVDKNHERTDGKLSLLDLAKRVHEREEEEEKKRNKKNKDKENPNQNLSK